MNTVLDGSGPATEKTDPEWTVAAAGIWVGRIAGVSVAVIEEKWRQGFMAIDRNARNCGLFATLEEAKGFFAPAD